MFRKSRTPLYDAFMSQRNMDKIQASIQTRVYQETGIRVTKQNQTTLRAVMESVFQDNAMHPQVVRDEEINHMNRVVINYSAPKISSAALSHAQYMKDSQPRLYGSPFPVMSHPQPSKKWRSFI